MNQTPDPAVVREFINDMASRSPDEYTVAQGELPGTVYVLRGALVHGVIDAVYLDRAEAIAAAIAALRDEAAVHGKSVITWTLDDVDGDGCASVHGLGRAVHVEAVPLYASHGLPVVDEAAVTAALDGAEIERRLQAIYELRRLTSPAGERCHNCFGPGPLVPHVHGMRVCQRCFPEPDAFAPTPESARAAQDGGAA